MLILFPTDGYYDLFEQSLSTDELNSILDSLDTMDVILRLPKFNSEPDMLNLKEILSYLGMPEAFMYPDANFSGIDGEEDFLFLQSAVHKAFIKVNETGVEAAAATGSGGGGGVGETIEDYRVVQLDRPFIYLILDKETRSILFMGRVLDPTETPLD